jgi:8-amino-7-oxononanoate synthase
MSKPHDRLEELSAEEKRALLKELLKQQKPASKASGSYESLFPPGYELLRQHMESDGNQGISDLMYQSFDGINGNLARHAGRDLVNFCSYNYLGMSGDPVVSRAAIEAIVTYGTSVSASRVISGERPIHRELESELADWLGTEDAVTFVGGFSTNEDTIGHLFGAGDLILYDSLIHASIQEGAKLSGATVVPFPHNNADTLDNLLQRQRKNAKQVLIVAEGVYSMDGDIADLPRLVDVKKRHNALLMIDEAHSIGVLGPTGRGIGEYHDVDPGAVDLWMGTLSKTFASCGGYIAGVKSLVSYLRYTAPGFVFSVGISPPNTAAALASLRLLRKEPERVARLRSRADLFRQLARQHGLDIGASHDTAIVPVIVGASRIAALLSRTLLARGVLALPIAYPAVPEKAARLRYFISSMHTEQQIRSSVEATAACLADLHEETG